jgi:hypothetical protein
MNQKSSISSSAASTTAEIILKLSQLILIILMCLATCGVRDGGGGTIGHDLMVIYQPQIDYDVVEPLLLFKYLS